MMPFVVAFGILLHVLLWGTGAALLAMPRPWRRFWPVLVPIAGFALQSAVVWLGAHTSLAGTAAYAWPAQVVPLILLAWALRRHGVRAAWNDIGRFGLVALTMGATLALLVIPLALASRGLTTISLGSCDAADYAAGARVLQEFASNDRAGFLGLTEVVRVLSVDNFFDYWIRLNHFTPSALIAFNGTILDCAPHQVTSLMTMVVLAGSLPLVFWMARAVVGYSGVASLVIAGIYGISPITWYAVGHVSPGQLLAAQAIGLLTWAGVALWRGRLGGRRARQFICVLAIAYWTVLGSYNFIIIVALVPAVAYAGGSALWRRQWARWGCWLAAMLLPLALVTALFYERVAGLAERLTLLRSHDFGWKIPMLTPEGWLGMVSGPHLAAWDFLGVRWIAAIALGGAFAWALWRAVRQNHPGAWLVASLVVPVLAGYFFLQARAAQLGTNASYDAYKLFAVFYPLLLPALCWWITLRRSRRIVEWFGVVGFAAVVVLGNVAGAATFGYHLARTPLIVDGALRQLRRIEAAPEVTSINLLLPSMWERLWANVFLLRKPQYFLTDTYEARWGTPLRGEWNLESDLVDVQMGGFASRTELPHHRLTPAAPPGVLAVSFAAGWHDEERSGGERWRWSRGDATLSLENRGGNAMPVVVTIEARALETVVLDVTGPDGTPRRLTVETARGSHPLGRWDIPPGRSELRFDVAAPAAAANGDQRVLGICIHRVIVAPPR